MNHTLTGRQCRTLTMRRDGGGFVAEFISKAYIAPVNTIHGFSRLHVLGRFFALITDLAFGEHPLLDVARRNSETVDVQHPYSNNLAFGRIFTHGILRCLPGKPPNLKVHLIAGTEVLGLHGLISVRPPETEMVQSQLQGLTIPPVTTNANRWEFTVFGRPDPNLEWSFRLLHKRRNCTRIWHRIAVTYRPAGEGGWPTVDIEILDRSAFPSHALWLRPPSGKFQNKADLVLQQGEFAFLWKNAPPPRSLSPFAADELPHFVHSNSVVDDPGAA